MPADGQSNAGLNSAAGYSKVARRSCIDRPSTSGAVKNALRTADIEERGPVRRYMGRPILTVSDHSRTPGGGLSHMPLREPRFWARRMKHWVAAVVAGLTCMACDRPANTPAYLARAAADAFSLDIADTRLSFQDVQTFHALDPERGQLLCGRVDIRDGQGRLTGARRFLAYRRERLIFIDPLPGDIPLMGRRGPIAPLAPKLKEALDSGCTFDRSEP